MWDNRLIGLDFIFDVLTHVIVRSEIPVSQMDLASSGSPVLGSFGTR